MAFSKYLIGIFLVWLIAFNGVVKVDVSNITKNTTDMKTLGKKEVISPYNIKLIDSAKRLNDSLLVCNTLGRCILQIVREERSREAHIEAIKTNN